MSKIAKRMLVLVCLGMLLATAPRTGAAAEATAGPDVGRAALMAVDVFPVRVGGFLRMVVGGIFLVPVTALSALTMPFERNPAVFRENAELYVVEPFDYTFRRPLGEDFAGN